MENFFKINIFTGSQICQQEAGDMFRQCESSHASQDNC